MLCSSKDPISSAFKDHWSLGTIYRALLCLLHNSNYFAEVVASCSVFMPQRRSTIPLTRLSNIHQRFLLRLRRDPSIANATTTTRNLATSHLGAVTSLTQGRAFKPQCITYRLWNPAGSPCTYCISDRHALYDNTPYAKLILRRRLLTVGFTSEMIPVKQQRSTILSYFASKHIPYCLALYRPKGGWTVEARFVIH